MTLLVSLVTIFFAYFVKGFSGFGPSLIIIPVLSQFMPLDSTIYLATILDLAGGLILLLQVHHLIPWKRTSVVIIFMLFGTWAGTYLLKSLPHGLIEKMLGVIIILFVIVLWWKSAETGAEMTGWKKKMIYLVSLVSGILGGMMGISGPPIVLYMKFSRDKTVFRNELIAIFAFAAAFRLLFYWLMDFNLMLSGNRMVLFGLFMLFGLLVGQVSHSRVAEETFNKTVALLLLVPALNLIF